MNVIPASESLTILSRQWLGSLLYGESEDLETVGLLSAEEMPTSELRAVAKAIRQLALSDETISAPTINAVLRTTEGTKPPADLLVALLEEGLPDHAMLFFEHWLEERQRLLLLGRLADIVQGVQETTLGLTDAVRMLREATDSVYLRHGAESRSLQEAAAAAMDTVVDAMEGRRHAIPTGIPELDRVLSGGFKLGQSYIIAGPTSIGKSSFAIGCARRALETRPVLYFSFEMSDEDVILAMIAQAKRLDLSRVRNGDIGHEEQNRLAEGRGDLEKQRLTIVTNCRRGTIDIMSALQEFTAKSGPGLVVVDTITRLYERGTRFESRQKELAYVSDTLDYYAGKFGVPILSISQVNRAASARTGDHRPKAQDLRDCGELEEHADVVMLLYSEEYTQGKVQDIDNTIELVIAKNRFGPKKNVPLAFLRKHVMFAERVTKEETEAWYNK